ncbi:MAG: endolytic transglycosylase MltG [Parcubacteria group bacterium]|nr:endolytic transglycosylase MltG [Parcubacteria group bacterium]
MFSNLKNLSQTLRPYIDRAKGYLHLPQSKRMRITVYGGATLVLVFFFFFISAPIGFPSGSLISIEKGMTLTEAARVLDERKIVQSPFMLKALVFVLRGEGGIQSAEYFLPKPQNVLTIAWRLTHGQHGLNPIRVTFPEGVSNKEIALVMKQKFPNFDDEEFLRIADNDEGYLFPDTYYFLPKVEPRTVLLALTNNFKLKLKDFEEEVLMSGHTIHEILTMASLLEKEAYTYEDMRVIAGLLWKRIEIGMPLQVDATFLYINGKTTFDLTLEDLRKNESPYNTYKHKGLPPGPIVNPGLLAIRATLNPRETPYLFYLSDLASNIHFSRTFDEHKVKKARYLP